MLMPSPPQPPRRQRHTRWPRTLVILAVLGLIVNQAAGQQRYSSSLTDTGKSLAILIGVQDYGALGNLKYCQGDVELLAGTLKNHCGFDRVVVMTESSPEELRPGLDNLTRELRRQLQAANEGGFVRVLVYFSGHGYRDSQGRLYLAPPDCSRKNLELTGLPVSYVRQLLDGCTRVPVKLLTLDCCHAGAAKGSLSEMGGGTELAAAFRTAKGLLTIASCMDDELSLEWEDKHQGLFTYWLCRALEGEADGNRDGIVDTDELNRFIHPNVLETSAELGQEQNVVFRPSNDWRGVAALAGRQSFISQASEASPATVTPFEKGIAEMAKKLANTLRDLGKDSVAVGHIMPPPQYTELTTGPGIATLLRNALDGNGIAVLRRAAFGIQGRFSVPNREVTVMDPLTVKLTLELIDDAGETRQRLSGDLAFIDPFDESPITSDPDGVGAIASIAGSTAVIPVSMTTSERHELLQQQLHGGACQDGPTLQDSQILPGKDSPYAVEILAAGHAKAPRSIDGLAYVDLKPGDTYTIRLTNRSKYDAAVTLTIDGINVFAFSEMTQYRHFIIPAGESFEVEGWHRTNNYVNAFVVEEYANGPGKGIAVVPGSIGSITATFAAAWAPGDDPPLDEGMSGRSMQSTGQGERIAVEYQEVRRHVGLVRAAVTVRYGD